MIRIIYPRDNSEKIVQILIQFTLGYLFSFLIIGLILTFHKGLLEMTFSGFSSFVVSILLGLHLVFILLLMLVERVRIFCLSIFSASIPIILLLMVLKIIIGLNALIFGLLIGLFVGIYLVYNVRFDLLSRFSTYLIHIFLLIFMFNLFMYAMSPGSYILSQNQIMSILIIITLTLLFWRYICNNLKGITSSHVFIFGDTGSGKSVFLSALYLYLIKYKYGGVVEESIITLDEERKKALGLGNLANNLQRGEVIESTKISEIALYKIPCKVGNIIPLNVYSIDYPGFRSANINKNDFLKNIQDISSAFSKDPKQLRESIQDNDFLEDLKGFNSYEFDVNFDKIAEMVIYDRLLSAGKILFLIDGTKLNTDEGEKKLQKNLQTISEIIKEFGNSKHYGFVVTKADAIKEISESVGSAPQNSVKAKEIEDNVYCYLMENHLFRGIMNSINPHPILNSNNTDFYLLSIDKNNKSDVVVPKYNPWRLSYVARFILKF